jgi:hypothetical protein
MGIVNWDCNKCKHQNTEVCQNCPANYNSNAECFCHISVFAPCKFCEDMKFEED